MSRSRVQKRKCGANCARREASPTRQAPPPAVCTPPARPPAAKFRPPARRRPTLCVAPVWQGRHSRPRHINICRQLTCLSARHLNEALRASGRAHKLIMTWKRSHFFPTKEENVHTRRALQTADSLFYCKLFCCFFPAVFILLVVVGLNFGCFFASFFPCSVSTLLLQGKLPTRVLARNVSERLPVSSLHLESK